MHKWVIDDNGNRFVHSTLDDGYDFFITDKWNVKLHFKISTFMVPSGLLSEAVEVIDDPVFHEPRVYMILSDFGSDIEEAENQLKEKLKKGINKKYLEYSDKGYSIKGNKIKGRFMGEYFEVDGLKLSPEEFLQTCRCYEGWGFSLKFHDLSE